jgi:hypothetical protein
MPASYHAAATWLPFWQLTGHRPPDEDGQGDGPDDHRLERCVIIDRLG